MNALFEKLGYTSDESEKLEAHIDEALEFIDPAKISAEYQSALKAKDRAGAIRALAAYYRARPSFNVSDLGNLGYDKDMADRGVLGKMREINVDYDFGGGRIKFLFNPTIENPPVNHEWLWQLNRHYWWGNMARAYDDTKDEKYAAAWNKQLLDWVAETYIPESKWNDPGSAFRTIECGIRLMGCWQTVFDIFRKSKSVNDETIAVMLGSMHRQACHLTAHPTRGNWLLMETNGIYAFGAIFGEFRDAEAMRLASGATIINEIKGQILPDGLQYELSPDYHSVSLHCAERIYRIALATKTEGELPEEFIATIYKMAMAAAKLATPAFIQPRTNDCFTIRSRHLTDYPEKMFPDELLFKYINSARKEGAPPVGDTASVFLPWSGFAVMRSDWGAEASYLCFDVGPLGMAHSHQDKLNINLFKGDEELIFDDGGGQYEISPERTYGLSAYDHNTVTVDGKGQDRKEPKKVDAPIDAGWISNEKFDYAYGIYDDEFEGEIKPATHKREVRFEKPDFFIVRDTLESTDGGEHTYGIRFHMDTTNVKLTSSGVLAEYGKRWDLLIAPISDDGEASSGYTVHSAEKEPLLGWYIGRNEQKNHPATTILMDSEPSKLHHFTNVLIPFEHGTKLPEIRQNGKKISVTIGGRTYDIDISNLSK